MSNAIVTTRKSLRMKGDKGAGSLIVNGTMGDAVLSAEIPDGLADSALRAFNCAAAMKVLLENARHLVLLQGVAKCQ